MSLALSKESAGDIAGECSQIMQIAQMLNSTQEDIEIQRRSEVRARIPAPLDTAVSRGLPRWVEAPLAFIGLVLAAPLIGLAGLAIAVTSGRPIVFRQIRVGKDALEFELCKLRTMKPSVDGPQITSGADARITRLGKFLRHTKLDELPTLWNVLRGEMSLVGPRPEVSRFVNYEDPRWQKVLSVRPGITDPVTLQLRSEAELLAGIEGDTEHYYVNELQPAKLEGYVAYLEARSWSSDLRILLRTLVAVVVPAKADSFTAGEHGHSAPVKDEVREGSRR